MTDSWGERHQSALYLTSMAVGVVLSLFCPPEVSEVSDALVPYALAVLLFANFMGVPFGRGQERERNGVPAAASRGFTLWLITLNFIVVPLLVMILLPTFLDSSVIALAVALVVLAPCIDYVVVFTRYAGGDSTLLLRKTPLLLGLQILIIPIWTSIYTYIGIFAYKDLGSIFPLPASAYAALLVVMIPALAAYLVQRAHHTPKIAKYAKTISDISETYMVGIMCVLLTLMCTAYARRIGEAPQHLVHWVPFYFIFALCAGMLGFLLPYTARYAVKNRKPLTLKERKAIIFSVVTRNALVMFPVILALSERLKEQRVPQADLMQPAVLTQTMVELIVMIVFVRILRPLHEELVAEPQKSKENVAGVSHTGHGTATLIRDLTEEKRRQPE